MRRALIVVALLLVSLSALAALQHYPMLLMHKAARTSNLLSILGIAGDSGDYASLNGATTADIVPDAQYLGITKWRDGMGTNPIYKALYAAGISMIALPWPTSDSVISDHITSAGHVAAIGPGALFAVEGPDEPGNFGFTYDGMRNGGGASWAGVAAWQSAWYAAVHANSIRFTKTRLTAAVVLDC